MAKDPATLWYWNDWHSGTVLMSRFLKGCYMDLLHAQFNNGRLSLEEIKTCLGSDFGQSWPTLQKKFMTDDKGLFFNERLEDEQLKRAAYSASRRNNRVKKEKPPNPSYDTTYVKHMSPHMENENENRNEDVDSSFGKSENLLSEMEAGKTVEFCKITLHRDYQIQNVYDLWEAFLINGKKGFYLNESEIVKHFRNWIKTQPDIKNQKNGQSKQGTSEARGAALKNW